MLCYRDPWVEANLVIKLSQLLITHFHIISSQHNYILQSYNVYTQLAKNVNICVKQYLHSTVNFIKPSPTSKLQSLPNLLVPMISDFDAVVLEFIKFLDYNS